MSYETIRDSIADFLAYVDAPPAKPSERDRGLARRLDVLGERVHELDPSAVPPADYEGEIPRDDYDTVRATIAEKFGEFGFYSTVKTSSKGTGEPSVTLGDAIEDLTDLTLDMREVLAVWNEHGPDAAVLQFFELYWVSWGRDCRDLQRYVYDRQQKRHFG